MHPDWTWIETVRLWPILEGGPFSPVLEPLRRGSAFHDT